MNATLGGRQMTQPLIQVRLSRLFVVGLLAFGTLSLDEQSIGAADELPKESQLPLGLANKAIQAAVDACKKMDIE